MMISKITMRLLLSLLAVLSLGVAIAQQEPPENEDGSDGDVAVSEQEDDAAEPDEAAVDEEETIDEEGLDDQGFEQQDDDDFIPTEEIPTDQSIPFPTDI